MFFLKQGMSYSLLSPILFIQVYQMYALYCKKPCFTSGGFKCSANEIRTMCFERNCDLLNAAVFKTKNKMFSPHLVHNGRLSTEPVIWETEAAPLAAVVRL